MPITYPVVDPLDVERDFEIMLRRLVRATREVDDQKVQKLRVQAETLLFRKGSASPYRLDRKMTLDLFMNSGAKFSPCGRYRYRLWRIWDTDRPFVLFLMLNPSTADENTNDPTVERCERRARQMGFGGIEVCNLFAFRATDPADMLAEENPVGEGEENDRIILEMANQAGLIVCAWGAHGSHKNRSNHVVQMLHQAGLPLFCFVLTDGGEPKHPLYIGYDRLPRLWK